MIQGIGAPSNETTASSNAGPESPPYRLYAAILCLFLVVRFGDLMVRDMEWTVWVNQSKTGWSLSMAFAALTAIMTAQYLKGRVADLLAWLMCGFVGASAALLASSVVGMLIGFTVGGYLIFRPAILWLYSQSSTFLWVGSYAQSLGGFVKRIGRCVRLPIFAGLLSGVTMAAAYIYFGQGSLQAELATVGLSALVGLSLFCGAMCHIWMPRAQGGRRLPRWYVWTWSIPLFFGFAIAGLLLGLVIDTQHRRSRLGSGVRTHSSGLVTLVLSLDPRLVSPQQIMNSPRLQQVLGTLESCTLGIRVGMFTFGPQSTDADAKIANGFPLLNSIVVETNSGLTDAGIADLNLHYLTYFQVQDGTHVTDTGVAGINKSRLQMLMLDGAKFSDAALNGIENASVLRNLSLRGTKVTTAGFRKVNPSAPLFAVDLSNTQVDDGVFEQLGQMSSLAYLQLSGTRVTGSGLKQLSHSSLQHLSLDDTPLDERYLLDLLPAQDDPGLPLIGGLSLRNVRVSANGLKTISRINGIGFLDLRGSEVDFSSMKLISQLPLTTLVLDGTVQPEVLKLTSWATELQLNYDVEVMNPNEIRQHFEQLVSLIPPNAAVSATIRNLPLTENNVKQILICLQRAGTGSLKFSFQDAIDPETQERRPFRDRFHFVREFREWNVEVEKNVNVQVAVE